MRGRRRPRPRSPPRATGCSPPTCFRGKGRGGGGWDSFDGFAEQSAAIAALDRAEIQARLDRVLAHALNGSTAAATVVGFSWGGTEAFAYAAGQPRLAGAVIFYGQPPPAELLQTMMLPVLGLYGAADDFVTPSAKETEAIMLAAGRRYVAKVFPAATHGFVPRQEPDGGPNARAAADAWREMLAFLRAARTPARTP